MDPFGNTSWYNNPDAYRRMREEAGLPSVDEVATPAGPTASACDEVANQLAHLGLHDRRRASDAGAALASRNALPGLGRSTRLPSSAAAALVGRESYSQSARISYVPEPPPDSLEYVAQPARHSSAYASHPPHADAAPRRKGGLIARLGKTLGKAFSIGSSGRDFSSSARSASSRHSVDASFLRDSTLRLDPHSPGRELARSVTEEAPADAEVTRHDSQPAEMPAPRAPRRDDERDAIRRIAASAMQAAPTTLPRPDLRIRNEPHPDDAALIERARAGLMAANPPIKKRTIKGILLALRQYSAWLAQIDKPAMQGRLFSDELLADVHKFVALGGAGRAPAALGHLRQIESSRTGTANVPTREKRWKKQVPDADLALIEGAFGTDRHPRDAAKSFSEWLALNRHPALTDPIVDENGQESGLQLHSEHMMKLVDDYVASPEAQYPRNMSAVLNHLRTFERQGTTNVKRKSWHFGIPEADARLVERYKRRARELAANSGRPLTANKRGDTPADQYAIHARAFSDWLQEKGRPSIAAQLHDDDLLDVLALFAERASAKFRKVRAALVQMRKMFPREDPIVTFGRIGHDLFVNALGMLALAPDMSVMNTANSVAADFDDLLVFLDAQAEDGLTEAGRALVRTFDGRALEAANAAIARRRRAMRTAAAEGAGLAPGQALPPMQATPVGWSQVHWSDAGVSAHQDFSLAGSMHSDGHGEGHGFAALQEVQPSPTGSYFDDLSSINSSHHQGGFEFDLNDLSEEAQRERTDSAYAGLSSFVSVPGYDDPMARARSPSEVAGPSRPAQRQRTDSAYAGLSSIVSVPGYDGRAGHAATPSEVTGPYRPVTEIVDVDDRPSPGDEDPDVASRLSAPGAWLRSDDIANYSQEFLRSFARELGPGGRERLGQMIGIGDPSVLVRHLINGTARQQEAVRAQLTASTLLLPVNSAHDHWSLLVIHRGSGQGIHYDSMIPPHLARAPGAMATPQFQLARQLGAALGVSRFGTMPMAMQPDAHSCGDHVLAGIEALARRIVTGQHQDLWDLGGIRPSRQRVVDTVTRAQAPDLDRAVADDWIHGDRYASPEVMAALATAGVHPTEARPQTRLQISDQLYAANLVDGRVWLSWTPTPGADLSSGVVEMDRRTLLGRIGAEMGHASGRGLNCLLDSVVQLHQGMRRGHEWMPQVDGQVQQMRMALAAHGATESQGEIDVYEGGHVGALLAGNLNLRLQFIQEINGRTFVVHPVIGQEGPLVRILHTPGHFQPLWPAQP